MNKVNLKDNVITAEVHGNSFLVGIGPDSVPGGYILHCGGLVEFVKTVNESVLLEHAKELIKQVLKRERAKENLKPRTIYKVISKVNGVRVVHELLPKEFHLIKTMLKDGHIIKALTKEQISPSRFKMLFG